VRSLSADINAFAAAFSSPRQVALSGTGYQCACFSADYTGLFLLDLGGTLYSYDIPSDTLVILATTSYGGLTDCYLDNPINSIVLVTSATSSVSYIVYDLTTLAQTNTSSISGSGKFIMDPNFRFYTLFNNNITYFKIHPGTICSRGTVIDVASQVCVLCSVGCAACVNIAFCTICAVNYMLDANNSCVSNGSANAKINEYS
jgi:hypothetical protein